ncbi:hypothetical protein OsI_11290 [Oryza sativa Indica Group]|uniref:Uncharacterized protein n=4 Tax=Oryza TaxID=4527 RepID=Q10MC9_ORYSJ|nr:hypothetical protein LOC_Os03g19940 [Oryza sativa Japonica Group]EAY89750.1 hypothetical protein OsI_11290 [Oryza sativa Indica Group]BAF11844.1 Os03g0313800 [Oryza sativa Japonica Group]|eukprot:NP_001049930.1 Os03g0313800 [Oryza sativa Japonica Group]
MGGSLVSMLRWPPDLGVPSLAALLPSSAAGHYAGAPALRGWHWQHWWPERLGSAVRRWPELVQDFSPVVDAVLWGLVTAIESVALFSMSSEAEEQQAPLIVLGDEMFGERD